eukprot:CAMPEP_0170747008 /NCGR_PEP_ID=MMETSP0437-20130122/9097_1 /TAXON_ID=0 /ORGANISM="Sexangularia sp." /LENGTH=718 /DNA_ID=CAMNT_0011085765 /DNA_START=27 /DNA_END=2181 /DNA_ORIENTATION=-
MAKKKKDSSSSSPSLPPPTSTDTTSAHSNSIKTNTSGSGSGRRWDAVATQYVGSLVGEQVAVGEVERQSRGSALQKLRAQQDSVQVTSTSSTGSQGGTSGGSRLAGSRAWDVAGAKFLADFSQEGFTAAPGFATDELKQTSGSRLAEQQRQQSLPTSSPVVEDEVPAAGEADTSYEPSSSEEEEDEQKEEGAAVRVDSDEEGEEGEEGGDDVGDSRRSHRRSRSTRGAGSGSSKGSSGKAAKDVEAHRRRKSRRSTSAEADTVAPPEVDAVAETAAVVSVAVAVADEDDAVGGARRLAAQLASANKARETETSADAEEFRALLEQEQARGSGGGAGGARTSGRRKSGAREKDEKKGEKKEKKKEEEEKDDNKDEKKKKKKKEKEEEKEEKEEKEEEEKEEKEEKEEEEEVDSGKSLRVGRGGGVRLSGSFVMRGGKLEAEGPAKTLKSPRLWGTMSGSDELHMQSPRSLEFKRKDQEDYRSHDVRVALAKHAHHDEGGAEGSARSGSTKPDVPASPKRSSSGRRKRRSSTGDGPDGTGDDPPAGEDYPDAEQLTSEVDAEAAGEEVEVFVPAGRPRTGSILRSHTSGGPQAALLSPRKKVSLGGDASLGAIAKAAAASSSDTLAVPFAGDTTGPAPIETFWTAFDKAVAAAVAKASSSLVDAGATADLAALQAQLAAQQAEIHYLRSVVGPKVADGDADSSSSTDSSSSSEELMVQVE